MRIAVQTEKCGGFIRFLPVRSLDQTTRRKAQQQFLIFQTKGVIFKGLFSDQIWKITDCLHRYTMDFGMDAEVFHQKAERWIGCTAECYQECMKAYIALHLGTFSLLYLRSIISAMKLIAGMTADEAGIFSGDERVQLVDFLSLIPESNDLRDAVIESMEEQKWRSQKAGPRSLADFSRYLKFNRELDVYWLASSECKKQYYFPVYFWWKLTAILPLRVTEFLVTPRDCVHQADAKFLLTVRRTRLKKGSRKLSYTIEGDYLPQKYEIPQWLFQEIRLYQEMTDKEPFLSELGTLLVPDRSVPLGYFTYVQLHHRLRRFCLEALGSEDYPIRAGDTRHLAMINLILSGGSPVICRELAGHDSIDISSNYYANLSTIIESVVYERCHNWPDNSSVDGFLRFPAVLPRQKIRVKSGWCDAPEVEQGNIAECLKNCDRDGHIGNCINCIHFFPDSPGLRLDLERKCKKAVDEDGQYLMQMIEMVRKGLGYQEDIQTALLRLQNSGCRYSSFLFRKYREAGENGPT